jgi:hypothetical protein
MVINLGAVFRLDWLVFLNRWSIKKVFVTIPDLYKTQEMNPTRLSIIKSIITPAAYQHQWRQAASLTHGISESMAELSIK